MRGVQVTTGGGHPDDGGRIEPTAGPSAARHPATTGLLRWFEYGHLPEHLQVVSRPIGELAHAMVAELPDGPELSAGLRKLLEAKDCLVRAALDGVQSREALPRCPHRVHYVGDPYGSRGRWLECSLRDGHGPESGARVHRTADGATFE
jgi:hypothetical protein